MMEIDKARKAVISIWETWEMRGFSINIELAEDIAWMLVREANKQYEKDEKNFWQYYMEDMEED